MKRTKIVATLGPSTAKKETLKQMFLEGLNVCRLNFSHGGYDAHLESLRIIRELNEELALLTRFLAPIATFLAMTNNNYLFLHFIKFYYVTESKKIYHYGGIAIYKRTHSHWPFGGCLRAF